MKTMKIDTQMDEMIINVQEIADKCQLGQMSISFYDNKWHCRSDRDPDYIWSNNDWWVLLLLVYQELSVQFEQWTEEMKAVAICSYDYQSFIRWKSRKDETLNDK